MVMADLTIKQASEFAKERGKTLSISYLNRLANKQPGTLGAIYHEMPTGVGFYTVDEAKLIAYIQSHPEKPQRGRRPKAGEA